MGPEFKSIVLDDVSDSLRTVKSFEQKIFRGLQSIMKPAHGLMQEGEGKRQLTGFGLIQYVFILAYDLIPFNDNFFVPTAK